jgi:serine/threonine-protein kinase
MRTGDQVGPFVIEKALGSGAMGTVFRARHAETGQRVAVKVVAPGLAANPTSLERFKRESAILKQLKHPNIVRLVATGRYQGAPFYAMEYVEGESLDRALARRGRITWEELVALGRQLCSALQHVHERGIIHRDLKPSNVMVLADGTVKLTDFGIAKDTDVTALTAANCTVGTASYMSPEQCKGSRDLTPRSDLYSLGVMFFELLTGKKPFYAESTMDMFMLHIGAQPERPSRLVFDIPVWLDTLIVQLLEKEPEQRPHNAAAVGEALDRVQEKVLAQQSAGADLARGRVADRRAGGPVLEEEDREAARTLLGKKKKKKRKKQAEPFYRRTRFRAAVLASLLGVILWVFYATFIKKPSPDALYERAVALMYNPETHKEAWEGPIADFLRYYPDRGDAQARQMRAWDDQVAEETREQEMLDWRSRGLEPDGEAERRARAALTLQEKGSLPAAAREWEKVVPLKDKQDRNQRAWGLVAAKYKKEADAALALWKKVEHEVTTEHVLKKKYQGEMPLEKLAAEAVRQGGKGDGAGAREKLEALRDEARQTHDRPWELVALWRLSLLPEARPQDKQAPEAAPGN